MTKKNLIKPKRLFLKLVIIIKARAMLFLKIPPSFTDDIRDK